MGGGSSAVGVANGLVDPAAQAAVAVGSFRGMAVGAGVGEAYRAVGAVGGREGRPGRRPAAELRLSGTSSRRGVLCSGQKTRREARGLGD